MMGWIDEMMRRYGAWLHLTMTLVSIPYVLLACFFVMIGRIASQRGLWAIFDTFLNSINWMMNWGWVLLAMTFLVIGGLGWFESQRWLGALSLACLLSASLGILLFYRLGLPTFGELLFLAPGLFILALCCLRVSQLRWE